MADNVLDAPQAPAVATDQQADIQSQIKEQMEYSLNVGKPLVQNGQQNTGEASANVDNVPRETNTEPAEPTAPVEPFSILREKFQYQNAEDAVKEIEELRSFRSKPQYTEFTIPDDESGAILRAIKAGKREEVFQHLDRELKIDRMLNTEVNKDNAADIVKLGMQLRYKDLNLTPDEISYRFNKQFAFPPKPTQQSEEDQASFDQRLNDWQSAMTDKQMELIIEAKLVKPELQKAKTNFVLPDIESPIDEGYVQYQKMLEERTKLDQEVKEAYKVLTPKDIQTKVNFKDGTNKIDFDMIFEPDAEGFAKAVSVVSDSELFWQTFTNSDGTPNRTKLLDAIYYANNKEKILRSAIDQGKNAAIKAGQPDNTVLGLTRQQPQNQEPSELEKQMAMSLRGYGGY